jgi:DNA-binding transcriptional ArsR family regulator
MPGSSGREFAEQPIDVLPRDLRPGPPASLQVAPSSAAQLADGLDHSERATAAWASAIAFICLLRHMPVGVYSYLVSDLYAVLAEPARRRILDRLLQSEASVTDLITVIGMSQTAMSKHLRVLREHNLVTARVDAQRRIYALNSAPLTEIDDWLHAYRLRWNSRIDALAQHLDALHPPLSEEEHEHS